MKLLFFIVLFLYISWSSCQYTVIKESIRWCTVGETENNKCLDFAEAVRLSGQFELNLNCVKAMSKDECLNIIDKHLADVVNVDPGEVFVGGRYHSLVPIMAERYGPSADAFYYSVAVIRRKSNIYGLEDLRGKKACFTGVGHLGGWVYPILTLMKKGIMPITDCNNHVRTAYDFFGQSCAPNSLLNKYNPTGDNPLDMCALCGDQGPAKCVDLSPFARIDGALRCLTGGRGEIAFVKHTTMDEMAYYPGLAINTQDYELLCPTGSRAPLNDFSRCNWGQVPAHAIMTSSVTSQVVRKRYQNFITQAVFAFGTSRGGPVIPGPREPNRPQQIPVNRPGFTPYQATGQGFQIFQSQKYSNSFNLLFQDATSRLESIPEGKQTFKDYIGRYEQNILDLRNCPVDFMKLCVISEAEMEKCSKMKVALKAQFLKPDLLCFRGRSQRDCMVAITNGYADVAMFDAGDVYTAGKEFGLMPIVAEQLDLDGPYFYAVAVARIEDPETDLLFVRGKRTCHTGMNFGAGWILPVSFLLNNERLRNHGCDGVAAAAEFFQKACVPGAMSPEYNFGFKQDTLCDLCHGSSYRFCRRDSTEDFFGYTGAFRCLIEGGGQIAFVKHTTIFENTNGQNKMWWSRNQLSEDYQLLCRDGSRAPANGYRTCNLGKVPSNAIVSRGDNHTLVEYYVNLFMYAQQYYGSKADDPFKFRMFYTEFPHNDLIFQDATQQLIPVPVEQRHYKDYLGYEFLHAATSVDCTAGSERLYSSIFALFICALLHSLVSGFYV